jgi:TolB-like protein/tetratricopeptide (TPR) repeat protein
VSFIVELRKRKVFRVATVYMVLAWIAIQAASIALPAFDAPAWALRAFIVLFALGLPVAVLLAWALELTPEGVRFDTHKTGNRRLLVLTSVLTLAALVWYFAGQPALRARKAVPVEERSIAVLPFVNISGDPANDYFSDGLADTTRDMLAQVKNLKVIARTSSFVFKGNATDVRQIGKTLGTAHLLEGSVQEAGDTVRITVQLIRVQDGSELWSRHFDRQLTDVFKIQDEIAIAVVQALQIALPGSEQQHLLQRHTDDVPAYQEYLKGVALLPSRKVPEMQLAAQHFEQAILLDPGYARAYVGACRAYILLTDYGASNTDEQGRCKTYLQRAIQIEPHLGEAYIALAVQRENAGDLDAAEREFLRGLALAPGDANGRLWYAAFLSIEYGRFDEALSQLRQGVEIDPLSPALRDIHVLTIGMSGQVDEALALSDQFIAEHADIARAYDVRGLLHVQRGDLVAALRDLRKQDTLDPASGFRVDRCNLLIDMGALHEAGTCLALLAQRAPVPPEVLRAQARLAMLRGDFTAALALIPSDSARWFPARLNRGRILLARGQAADALRLYRQGMPALFAQPVRRLYPAQATDAIQVGAALIRAAASAQGRALLTLAIPAVASRPYASAIAPRGWWEVVAHAQLNEPEQAFVALQAGVSAGYFLGLADIDSDPLLARLRADPRYATILAPARAKAAAQIDAARVAGVL